MTNQHPYSSTDHRERNMGTSANWVTTLRIILAQDAELPDKKRLVAVIINHSSSEKLLLNHDIVEAC
jgi:hypothetical protein